MSDPTPQEGELILYRTADDAVRVEVLYESETSWLDQRRIAELFLVEIPTISYHLKEIYASGELAQEPTLRKIPRVQREGNRRLGARSSSTTSTTIISADPGQQHAGHSIAYPGSTARRGPVAHRATQPLREFIVKGVLDDERLKMNKRRMSTPHHSQTRVEALGSYV